MIARRDPGPETWARWSMVVEVAAVVFTVALRWWAIRDRYVYSVSGDEASQLAIARTVSGSGPFHVLSKSFDAGFGILVSPIYTLVEDPELAFRLVLGANVVMAGLTLLVVRALVMRLLPVSRVVATWSAAIALALPGAVLQTPFSAPEVLVGLVVAATLLLAVMLQERRGWWPALTLAGTAASMVLVHSRLTGVVAAVAVVLVAAAVVGELPRSTAAVALVVLVVTTVACLQLNDWVYDAVWLDGADESERLGEILVRLTRPAPVLASFAGMAWHQLVATFGLVVVGAGHLVGSAVRPRAMPRIGRREYQRWKVLVILAAAAVPSAVFMAGRDLATRMVFGRYWDALAIPVVAVGVAFLLSVGRRRATRVLATTLVAGALAGWLFALARQSDLTEAYSAYGFGSPRRVSGLLGLLRAGDPIDVVTITLASLAGVVAVLAVLLLTHRDHHRRVLVVALALLATVATTRGSIQLNASLQGLDRWRPAMELVESGVVPDDTTVGFQLDAASWKHVEPRFPYTAYQFYEPDLAFVPARGRDLLDHDYAVSDVSDELLEGQGWELVWTHPGGKGAGVWRRP